MNKKTIKDITRSLLIDAAYFGLSRQDGAKTRVCYNGEDYIHTKQDDDYLKQVAADFTSFATAFEAERTPVELFNFAVGEYQRCYPGWRSPQGRPFPDHYFNAADDEARRIMKEAGIA